MKILLFLLLFFCLPFLSFSQYDTTEIQDTKTYPFIKIQDTNTYRFIKTDGGELIGKILSEDAREVLILTIDKRKIYIPQHAIKKKVIVKTSDFNNNGKFIGEDNFATRYFITTNALALNKGEKYVQWGLLGPEFQFGLGKNLGVGLMTSWVGSPIIGTIKKSWELGEKTQFAVGGLIGSGVWAYDLWIALPFGTLSFGDKSKNLAISGGYGSIWQKGVLNASALASIAGMIKISPKISLVFDSFILLPDQLLPGQTNIIGLLIPGVRWHREEGKAFQIGFTGMIVGGKIIPVPIPMLQWYRSL